MPIVKSLRRGSGVIRDKDSIKHKIRTADHETKGTGFFPLFTIEKVYFPAAILPDPLQLARSWTAVTKKRTVEISLIFFVVVLSSLCLLTAVLVVVGVSLQLRALCSRAGVMVPAPLFSSTHFISCCVFAGGRPRLMTLCGLRVSRDAWDV